MIIIILSFNNSLVDIRFVEVLKTIFFFYYCLLFPCIWLGKKVIWGVFKDTAAQKQKAVKSVLKRAKRKGKQAKYGIIENEEDSKLVEQKQRHNKDTEKSGTTKNKKNDSSGRMNDKSNVKKLKEKKKLKTKSSNSGDHHKTNNSYDNGSSNSTMNNECEDNGQDDETKPLLEGILDTEQSSLAEQKVKKKRRGKKRPNKPHSRRRNRYSNKNKSSHSESESNSDQSVSNSDVSDDGSESTGNDTESNQSVLINIK